MYEIEFSEGVEKDLKKIRVYDRNIILGAAEKQLAHTPNVEGQDWEIVVLQTSAPFWKLIEKRRKEKTIPLREMRKRVKS